MKTLIFAMLSLFGQMAFANNQACFYENINYQGPKFCVVPGVVDSDLTRTGWNRRISSVWIEGEIGVTLYSQLNFGGNQFTIAVSRNDLRQSGWNDAASSYKTYAPAPQACFYKDINYGGAHFCLARGRQIENLVSSGWNDKISSVKIVGDASTYIFTDIKFGGRMIWVTQSTPSLVSRGWNDRGSSVMVYPKAGR